MSFSPEELLDSVPPLGFANLSTNTSIPTNIARSASANSNLFYDHAQVDENRSTTNSSIDIAKDSIVVSNGTTIATTSTNSSSQIFKSDKHKSATTDSLNKFTFKTRSESNLFQQLSFGHMNGIIKANNKRDIIPEEYPQVEPEDKSDNLSEQIYAEWEKEIENHNKNAKLSRTLWKVFGFNYTMTGMLYLLESLIKIAESFLLGKLLDWFDSSDAIMYGYIWAATLSSAVIIHALVNQYKFFLSTRIGMQIRVSLIATIYKKCMKLPLSRIASPGQIINMISNDVQRFEDASGFAYYILLGPLETLLIFYFLYQQLGWASLASVGVLLFGLVPLQSVFANKFARLRRTTTKYRDDRIKSLSDMIIGMIVVKLYAWEIPFMNRIMSLRNKELNTIRKISSLRATNEALFFASSAIISVATFSTVYLAGGIFTPSMVFTTLTYLQTVRMTMTNLFSKGLQFTSESVVSLQRIESFMKIPEIQTETRDCIGNVRDPTMLKEMNDPNTMIVIRNASFSWKPCAPVDGVVNTKDTVLKDITLRVRAGDLFGISGSVGAGKTSLLNAMLGELDCVSGHHTTRTTNIAYVTQTPFILPGTVRDNIVFGHPYRQDWFQRVTHACGLDRDFNTLPMRDHTFVGDRGITLSGGQRARVALARAVYADADIYLLDDPISALDSNTIKHIFTYCIQTLLKKKAVVLVTHLLQYMEQCDHVCLVDHGSIVRVGSFKEVAECTESKFAVSMKEYLDRSELDRSIDRLAKNTSSSRPQESHDVSGKNDLSVNSVANSSVKDQHVSEGSMYESGNTEPTVNTSTVVLNQTNDQNSNKHAKKDGHDENNDDEDDDDISDGEIEALRISLAKRRSIAKTQSALDIDQAPNPAPNNAAKMYNTEDVNRGSVGMKTYYKYIQAGASVVVMIGLLIALIVGQVLMLATDWWMSKWSAMSPTNQSSSTNLYIYIALAITTIIVSILRAQWFFSICMKSSETMFSGMVTGVFGVPIRFFQSNPHGRIMNRFSKDMSSVDEMLPQTFYDFIQRMSMIVGTIAVAAWVIPYVLLTLPAIIGVFMVLRQSYMKTARQLKRLEATTRSPVLSAMSTTLDGLALLRSFGAQDRFTKDFVAMQDNNTRVYFLFICAGRWLGLRLDVLAALFFTTVALCSVVVQSPLGLSSASVGLLLSYVLQLVGLLQWSVRQSSEVENLMISTERILEYSSLEKEVSVVKSEKPDTVIDMDAKTSLIAPDQRWPLRGYVEIKNMWLRYPSSLSSVLKNVTVTIDAGKKVGIVGRSGAGKSSFLQALFRLVEPSPPGSIVIDGIKTSDLGLRDLRSRISIIPQDPFCFKGTLRFNLDPFERHSDDELWRVLEAVELKPTVSALPDKLDSEVAENGSNWSVGERQLICLARAILRGSKLVVMDEATSSIDVRTDQLLHKLVGADTETVTLSRSIRQPAGQATTNTFGSVPNTASPMASLSATDASPIAFAEAAGSVGQAPSSHPDAAYMSTDSARFSRHDTNPNRSHSNSIITSRSSAPGFTSATVITIAHRLHTIIDYDTILVFDNGELVEQGAPWALLEKNSETDKSAFFARMVGGYEPETQQLLKRLAAAHKRIASASARRERRMTNAASGQPSVTSSSPRRGTLEGRVIPGSLDRRRRDTVRE